MPTFTRRDFSGVVLALGTRVRTLRASTSSIDATLRTGIARRKIPAVAAMAATATQTFYAGAFGKRDGSSGLDVTPNSIFSIASMTKAIATTAALQLVERGRLQLDEPASKHLPELASARVLHGYDASGKSVLHSPAQPITLRHLLTHTSGFAYDTWNQEMFEYVQKTGDAVPPGTVAPLTPLVFEPGTRWQYGYSVDWAGKLVEAVSGQTLEQYMQAHILQPLGMKDTSYIMTADKYDRVVSLYQKQPDGTMKENPRRIPSPPKAYSGGGGLYSTTGDYVRFMQMILNHGRAGKDRILEPKTVDMMAANQIGELGAGRLKSFLPQRSADMDLHPGAVDKWGLGFLINTKAYDNGRSAGSLAWAGIDNTFYWIDPKRGICATIMMQFLPFVDKEAVGLLGEFERSVYASLPSSAG
jgi:methyl acetate hydrolase